MSGAIPEGSTSLDVMLESIYLSIKRRTHVLTRTWRTWSISVYFGPSLAEPDGNVHALEWTCVAKTKHKNTETLPDLSTGGDPVLVQFNSTAIVSWTGKGKDELLETVTRSFDEQFSLR